MKKLNLKSKLSLNKETVAKLNDDQMSGIKGGITLSCTTCVTICGTTCGSIYTRECCTPVTTACPPTE